MDSKKTMYQTVLFLYRKHNGMKSGRQAMGGKMTATLPVAAISIQAASVGAALLAETIQAVAHQLKNCGNASLGLAATIAEYFLQ